MPPERSRALKHLALSYLATNALVFLFSRRALASAGLQDLIGALFLLAAILSVRFDDNDTARHGIRLGGVFPGAQGDDRSLLRALWESVPIALRELVVALAVAALILPIYTFAWPLFNTPPVARHFALDRDQWQSILTNLFAVALTEEMYFRGYVQTRVADALGVANDADSRRNLRSMAPAVVATSVLFALTHVVVAVTPARAAVFFPSLLFGALRVARGGIGAAVFLHAIFNLFEAWLEGR